MSTASVHRMDSVSWTGSWKPTASRHKKSRVVSSMRGQASRNFQLLAELPRFSHMPSGGEQKGILFCLVEFEGFTLPPQRKGEKGRNPLSQQKEKRGTTGQLSFPLRRCSLRSRCSGVAAATGASCRSCSKVHRELSRSKVTCNEMKITTPTAKKFIVSRRRPNRAELGCEKLRSGTRHPSHGACLPARQ